MASIIKLGNRRRAQMRRKGHGVYMRTFDTKARAAEWPAGIEADIARGLGCCRFREHRVGLMPLLKRDGATVAGAIDHRCAAHCGHRHGVESAPALAEPPSPTQELESGQRGRWSHPVTATAETGR